MKNKNLTLLVVAGAVLAALAWMTSRDEAPAGANRIGKPLLPDLAINAVDELVIASATQTARVSKVDNVWVLPDRYGYPADFETLRRLMLALSDLKIGQAFNASDRQRAQMALTPDAATTLSLHADGNPLVTLQLGVNREAVTANPLPYGMGGMTDGRYLTIKDDPMVYLVGDSLHAAKADTKQWMDTSLLEVPPQDVATITITNPEDGTFSLVSGDDGKLAFSDPEPGKPFDETKAHSLKGALNYLTLQDIADPEPDDDALGFTSNRTFIVKTKHGTTYSVRVSDPINATNERYIRVAVSHSAPSPEAATPQEDGASAGTPPDTTTNDTQRAAAEAAATEAREAAEALHAKLSPWTFRIASYKANTLSSTRDALVKVPEPPADNDQTDPSDPSDPSHQSAAPDKQPDKTNHPENKETQDE